jgi:16S rRNA (uracil1498-N3)-methyltransferase
MASRTSRYYFETLADTEVGSTVVVESSDAIHMTQVKRSAIGSAAELFDGAGLVARATIESIQRKKSVKLRIDDLDFRQPSTPEVHIACAVAKGERVDTMLDMLTQVGVQKISFIEFEYSVRKPSENRQKRWQRIAIEACKQSRRDYLPVIHQPLMLEQWLNQESDTDNDMRLVADPRGEPFLHSLPSLDIESMQTLCLVIGPEGGLSLDEITLLHSRGYRSVMLGTSIMRIETAAVAFAGLAVAACSLS